MKCFVSAKQALAEAETAVQVIVRSPEYRIAVSGMVEWHCGTEADLTADCCVSQRMSQERQFICVKRVLHVSV